MNGKKAGSTVPSIKCFINTGSDFLPLDESVHGQPLSGGKLPGGPPGAVPAAPGTYGRYMASVARLLSENSFAVLRSLLQKQPAPAPKLEEASAIDLISEKHGALYSVSRLRLRFADHIRSFAVNCAFSPEQQAFMQVEVELLLDLCARFDLPYLPRPLITANAPDLMLFVAEWFENHHEFHLSPDPSGTPVINVWRQDGEKRPLDRAKAAELYAQASKTLTAYLDSRSFSQIYPWHHGAGDFVVDESRNPVSLRLVTARGYRSLLPGEFDCKDKMLGALHFFVNLGIRMRIDRLDGTGEIGWAGPDCLPGIVRGFTEAWEAKRESADLPEAFEIFSLFLALSPDERLEFADAAAAHGRIEADEVDFLPERLPGHVMELSAALENSEF